MSVRHDLLRIHPKAREGEKKEVKIKVQTFYSNMGFPLYVTFCPHSFVSRNIGAHL